MFIVLFTAATMLLARLVAARTATPAWPYSMAGGIVLLACLLIGFIALAKAKTDGEWRWRWGEPQKGTRR